MGEEAVRERGASEEQEVDESDFRSPFLGQQKKEGMWGEDNLLSNIENLPSSSCL